jgi:hypothetical protein
MIKKSKIIPFIKPAPDQKLLNRLTGNIFKNIHEELYLIDYFELPGKDKIKLMKKIKNRRFKFKE